MHPSKDDHKSFCSSLALYHKLILRQVEISLPRRVLSKSPVLTDSVEDTLRLMYKDISAFQNDDGINASLMHIATSPLTAYFALQKSGLQFNEQLVIHLVGMFWVSFSGWIFNNSRYVNESSRNPRAFQKSDKLLIKYSYQNPILIFQRRSAPIRG